MRNYPPKNRMKKAGIDRFSTFLLVLSIIAFLVGIAPYLSMLGLLFYYLFLILIMIITIGLILMNEDFKKYFSLGDNILGYMKKLAQYTPHLLITAVVLAVISTILAFMSPDKHSKKSKIGAGIVFIIIPIVVYLFVRNISFV